MMTTPNPSCGPKILFLGVTALLLTVMSCPAWAQAGVPDVQTLCLPLEIQKGKPEEMPCLLQFGDVAERNVSDDTLTLKLDNGKTKIFKSNAEACQHGSDGCVEYRLVGYIASDRQFVMHVLHYESGFVSLVSRRNGEATKLEDWPHLSPSKKRFVVVAASDAWEIDNAIAMFSAVTDPPRLLWKFPTPHEYEQYAFDGWDSEGRVLLSVTSNADTATDFKHMATDLKLTAQGWQLRRPSGKYDPGVSVAQSAKRSMPAATPGR